MNLSSLPPEILSMIIRQLDQNEPHIYQFMRVSRLFRDLVFQEHFKGDSRIECERDSAAAWHEMVRLMHWDESWTRRWERRDEIFQKRDAIVDGVVWHVIDLGDSPQGRRCHSFRHPASDDAERT